MSRFYGQVIGAAETVGTRRGHQDIKVSAQSWDGSVITRLYYKDDELMCDIQIGDSSTAYGYTYFNGTLEELKKRLRGCENED